jgi:hypothetical protein
MSDEQRAFTVTEFCAAFRVSRTKLYELWKAGIGPVFYYVGHRRFIAADAALVWQRACPTNPTPVNPALV